MEEIRTGKNLLWWVIGVMLIVAGGVTTCNLVYKTAKDATHADDGVRVYEEFQEIYNSCSQINTDLAIIKNTPEGDKQFEQFSKSQRINALKMNLNRWVEDYNAKSKMWGRSLWKAKSLPYQLSVNDFSNYNNGNDIDWCTSLKLKAKSTAIIACLNHQF